MTNSPPPEGFHVPEEQEQHYMRNESPPFNRFEFSEKIIRRAFIRKVYSILMVQLLVTLGLIALFMYYAPLKIWTYKNRWIIYVALATYFVTYIALACCGNVRRRFPQNFIFLGIFTWALGFLLGVTASRYNEESVLLAVGITAAVSLALTIFSFQTKLDFTMIGGILFVALIILILFGILAFFFPILHVVYACAGALLFSVFLVYDTQLMMGGEHRYSISPEEYVFAALNLFLDIVNIFTFMLQIFGSDRH